MDLLGLYYCILYVCAAQRFLHMVPNETTVFIQQLICVKDKFIACLYFLDSLLDQLQNTPFIPKSRVGLRVYQIIGRVGSLCKRTWPGLFQFYNNAWPRTDPCSTVGDIRVFFCHLFTQRPDPGQPSNNLGYSGGVKGVLYWSTGTPCAWDPGLFLLFILSLY